MRFKQWMEDLNALHQNTVTGFDTEKRHNVVGEVGDPKMTVTPNPQMKELLVSAKVPSSDQKTSYNTSILFKNVNFMPMPPGGQMTIGSYLITNPRNGQKYYLDQLSTHGHDVQVNCNCADFRKTFSKLNAQHGALLGDPDGGTVRNPNSVPGMCKHLMRVVQKLMDRGILNSSEPMGGQWPDHIERPKVQPQRRARAPKPKDSGQGYLF